MFVKKSYAGFQKTTLQKVRYPVWCTKSEGFVRILARQQHTKKQSDSKSKIVQKPPDYTKKQRENPDEATKAAFEWYHSRGSAVPW